MPAVVEGAKGRKEEQQLGIERQRLHFTASCSSLSNRGEE